MVKEVPLDKVYFDSEPDINVTTGPLCRGYMEIIAGNQDKGRAIIRNFLASVYRSESRRNERSTENFVRQIYKDRGIPLPADKKDTDVFVILDAAGIRFDTLHRPLLDSILRDGYVRDLASAQLVIMSAHNGKYYVHDGKNRCSILAALGETTIENVRIINGIS